MRLGTSVVSADNYDIIIIIIIYRYSVKTNGFNGVDIFEEYINLSFT